MTPSLASRSLTSPSAPELTVALDPSEQAERRALRESMRTRKSVDHFARGWYGCIGALIGTGLTLKLGRDTHGLRWSVGALAAGTAVGWVLAVVQLVKYWRLNKVEVAMLQRLSALDARMPKAPELF